MHETEIGELKREIGSILVSQKLVEKALLGDLSESERRGLLEEHHEHRRALFGDKKVKNDGGLVGDMGWAKEVLGKISAEHSRRTHIWRAVQTAVIGALVLFAGEMVKTNVRTMHEQAESDRAELRMILLSVKQQHKLDIPIPKEP